MRATGIIRRTDDLGRIVIPKEIRRTMHIREDEPLEIYLDGSDTICFRKYQFDMVSEIDAVQASVVSDWMYDIACKGTAEQEEMLQLANEHFRALKEIVTKFERSLDEE